MATDKSGTFGDVFVPTNLPSDSNRGEQRPAHASEGEWDQSLFPRPESSSTFDVDWQIANLPGGGRVAGNATGMDLHRRISGMARRERDEQNTADDRSPGR